MRDGFTYRGRHSNEFYTIVKTVGRPIIAPVKQVDEDIPYRDGKLDCSETGGRLYYDDKVLELDITILAHNTRELHGRASRFINWLAGGYAELIFDDMPLVCWIAKPADLESMSIELHRSGKTKIQFRCRPFNIFVHDGSGIPLDSDLALDSDVPLGFGDENEILNIGNGTITHNLYYYGSAPVRPKIIITITQGTELVIQLNGVTLKAGPCGSAQVLTMDCAAATISGNYLTGDFFELLPGDNRITVTCSRQTSGSCQIVFDYRHKFLYGDDF